MDALRCVDGSWLAARPVRGADPGRAAGPAQVTLELTRDGQPFALVGGRCRSSLTRLAARLAQAREDREQAAIWPDPDDRFPGPAGEPGPLRGFAAAGHELFALRSGRAVGAEPDQPDGWLGGAELRAVLRSAAQQAVLSPAQTAWAPGVPDNGSAVPGVSDVVRSVDGWQLSRRVILEAWGARGTGVRAVLTSAELATFLDTVLSEPVTGASTEQRAGRAKGPGRWLGGFSTPRWRQRGRMPDGTAQTGLPAVRTQA